MSMLGAINEKLRSPKDFIDYLFCKFFAPLIGDELFLRIRFRMRTGYALHLKNPQTYNEKIQWLKLYNRRPEYTQMVDKYEAKKYVSGIVDEKYIIPTLGVWNRAEDIDFDSLPEQFVLKCTHDSGGIVICRDKNTLNRNETITKFRKALSLNFYKINREWPYKNVKPRIIAEQYMAVHNSKDLPDYKFFCFDGEPKVMFVATDRYTEGVETKFDFYDMNWNHLDVKCGHPNSEIPMPKPKKFEEMKQLARQLSKGHCHIRVDLYDINDNVYFGELTFFHWSGFKAFEPMSFDYELGDMLKLPLKKSLN